MEKEATRKDVFDKIERSLNGLISYQNKNLDLGKEGKRYLKETIEIGKQLCTLLQNTQDEYLFVYIAQMAIALLEGPESTSAITGIVNNFFVLRDSFNEYCEEEVFKNISVTQ